MWETIFEDLDDINEIDYAMYHLEIQGITFQLSIGTDGHQDGKWHLAISTCCRPIPLGEALTAKTVENAKAQAYKILKSTLRSMADEI